MKATYCNVDDRIFNKLMHFLTELSNETFGLGQGDEVVS